MERAVVKEFRVFDYCHLPGTSYLRSHTPSPEDPGLYPTQGPGGEHCLRGDRDRLLKGVDIKEESDLTSPPSGPYDRTSDESPYYSITCFDPRTRVIFP